MSDKPVHIFKTYSEAKNYIQGGKDVCALGVANLNDCEKIHDINKAKKLVFHPRFGFMFLYEYVLSGYLSQVVSDRSVFFAVPRRLKNE